MLILTHEAHRLVSKRKQSEKNAKNFQSDSSLPPSFIKGKFKKKKVKEKNPHKH